MNRAANKSRSQWAELVAQYDNGEEREGDFCARHEIKLNTLRKWRYHFKNEAKAKAKGQSGSASFVKVNVRPSAVSQEPAVLCIGPDIRLECPASYDVLSLAQLALAVHHGR
ncbi:MAG: hypothetical protein V3U65_06205 [Granulosicoccaceae bacterium]